jgi:16S rRNA processing protein RimM
VEGRRAHLEIGYISRSHGLRGEVAVKTFDPASESLLRLERVLLRRRDGDERELRVAATRIATKEILVTFEGLEDRVGADRLVGATVLAFREDLPQPAEGEFFQGDLLGLEAFDESGAALGEVSEILESGPVPNLVIRGPDNSELIVPFADEFVPNVDMGARRLWVRPPKLEE